MLFLSIVILVGASNSNQSSWGLSDKIAVIASCVAFLQFGALVCTILVMIRSNRRQLRAYVLPEGGGIFDGTTVDPPQPLRANIPGLVIHIKNSGQTPAYRVFSWWQISVIPVLNENQLVVPPLQEQFSLSLGSSATFSKALWFDRPLTPQEIAEIANGVRAIYAHGRVEYRDAFNKQRITNFRVRYNGVYPPLPNSILNFSERGNDAN
jgi:hypothetical protein